VEYRLTDKGRALVPLIEQMRHYGQEWLMNGNGRAHDHSPPAGERATKTSPVPSGVGAPGSDNA
jgi:hypothetical protein